MTDKTEIKEKVKHHYEQWTCNRDINVTIIEKMKNGATSMN
jgi:hypothetical protein